MHVRIGLIDGEIVKAYTDNAEIMQEIEDAGGRIGSGGFQDVVVEDIDDAICFLEAVWSLALGGEGGEVTVETPNGPRTIDGKDVVWFRITK